MFYIDRAYCGSSLSLMFLCLVLIDGLVDRLIVDNYVISVLFLVK